MIISTPFFILILVLIFVIIVVSVVILLVLLLNLAATVALTVAVGGVRGPGAERPDPQVDEVEALKNLVDEFAQFARLRKFTMWLLLLPLITVLSACLGGGLPGSTGPSINTRAPVPVALLVPIGSADTNEQRLAQDLENA